MQGDGGDRIERAAGVALALATAVVVVHRLIAGQFEYTVWADRGLTRSAVAFGDLPTVGPELSYGVGARIPGGGFNTMLWLAEQLTAEPLGVWRVQVGLDALAALVLGWAVYTRFGLFAASVSAAAFVAADPNSANQIKLWNPAWMSIFVAAAFAMWMRAVGARDGRAVVGWAVALALAAQMHITAWLLLVALLPSVLLARIPHAGRWIAAATLGAVGTYAGYLWDELRTGWPNTDMLLHPTQVSEAQGIVSPDARPVQSVVDMLLALASEPGLRALADSTSPVVLVVGLIAPVLVVGVLFLLGAADSERAAARRRVVAGLLMALTIEAAVFARSRHYGFRQTDATRYLIAITPVAAALVGVASAGALHAARRWGPAARGLVAALLLASMGVRLAVVSAHTREGERSAMSWPRLSVWLGETRRITGWTGAELAGRLVVAEAQGRSWARLPSTPIDAILRPEPGFAGSAEPPCAVLFNSPRPGAVAATLDGAVLAATLGEAVPGPVLDAVFDLAPGVALAVYRPATGLCPTTMSQRYVLMPDEVQLRDASASLALGGVREVAAPDGHHRWVVSVDGNGGLGPAAELLMMVDIAWEGDELTATLISNSLRGHAWNQGFFANEQVLRPRLEVQSPDGQRAELVIAPGVVGGDGALTPLSSTQTVRFRGPLRFVVELPRAPGDPHAPVTVAVDLPVPSG